MLNKKMGKPISYVGIVVALLAVLLIPSSVVAASGGVTCTVSAALTSSNVSASSISYYSVTISWKTNGNATSQVFYDTEFHDNIVDYADHTIEDTAPVSGHSVVLTGLSSGRTYHYRVRSATVIDGSDFIAISEDYTFRTSSRTRTYYTETNLFGTETRFRISRTGEILKTIKATSEDDMLTITIPKGNIAKDKDGKRLKELLAAVNESPPDPPEDAHIIGQAYDFTPDGATFEPPITLIWNYYPDVLPEGVTEESLIMAYYDEDVGEWIGLVCEVDTENNVLTASVPHFTTFAVIGRVPAAAPAPAAFTIRSLGISPSKVAPGEEVTISVLVANTGGESGSYSVVLKINAVKEQEKLVTITAGRSRSVSFTVSKEDPGSYSVFVCGLRGSFRVVALLIIVPPAPAAFSVSSLAVEPAGVKPGEAVAVSIVVANTGGESGSYTVVLKINGVKEDEKSVTIAAGESQDVAFSVTREDPGNYTVDVDGLSGSFTVVALVVPPAPPGINWPLIGGIIGGVVIVAGLIIFFLKFRRRLGVAIRGIGSKQGK